MRVRVTNFSVIRVAVNTRGDWLFVQLETDDGLIGIGEASHGGNGPARDAIVTAILEQQCWPLLRGCDPRAVVAATTTLRPVAKGIAGATAVSACEQALWDIAGQAAGLPIYRLFGGAVRDRIPLYANVNRATPERTPNGFARSAKAAAAEGFPAIKCAPFDGMERRRVRDRDQRERVRLGLACIAAVRDAVGPEIELFVDCHSHFDAPTAVDVARELRDLGVTWFEEPLPTAQLEALQKLRPIVPGMELIGGETLYGIEEFWPYLATGVWDLIMPDVKHCGGISALHSICQLATALGIGVAPHNPSGPVAMAASAHVAAALPFVRWLEFAWGEVPWRAELFSPSEQIVDGAYVLSDRPGLGVELNESVVEAHRQTG